MAKTAQVLIPIVLLVVGLAAGYVIAYGMYQPYQTEVTKLKGDLTTTQATLSEIQSNYTDAQDALVALNNYLQTLLIPNITILSYPSQVSIGEDLIVSWNVTGGIPGRITHTEVHTVNATDLSQDIYLSQVFTGLTPQVFTATIPSPLTTGTFKFHIHADVDGKEVFTSEKSINVTAQQPFDIIVAHPNKAVSIDQGSDSTVTVNVVSMGSFSSPVTLSIVGLPSGVTATLSQTQVTPPANGQVNVDFTLTVAADAAVGTYSISVRGTSGSTIEADAMTLTMTQPFMGVTIEMRSLAFDPDTISVIQGTTVTWINYDSEVHNVMFGNLTASGDLQPGESWSYTFSSMGIFDYYCSIHSYMTGTVFVT